MRKLAAAARGLHDPAEGLCAAASMRGVMRFCGLGMPERPLRGVRSTSGAEGAGRRRGGMWGGAALVRCGAPALPRGVFVALPYAWRGVWRPLSRGVHCPAGV